MQYQSYGAWITGPTRITLQKNKFFQNYETDIRHEFKGIWLTGSPSNVLDKNDFVGNYGPMNITNSGGYAYRGIHVDNSNSNKLSCNTSTNLNQGFFFNGPACDHTNFRSNTMTDNLEGLYLSPGSIIGVQSEKMNTWPGSGALEAHFDGMPEQGLMFMSQFRINTSNQNSPLWASPRVPANNWFVPSGNEPPIGVPLSETCFEEINEDPPGSEANARAIAGTFEDYKGYPASGWEARLDAFAVLAAHPELRPENSPEAQFYNTHDTGNTGKLQRARDAWDNITVFTASFESSWNANQADIAAKLGEIRAQTQLMQEAETESEQQQIAQTLGTLQSELTTLQQTNQSLSEQYKSDVADRANQLAADLDNVNTTDVWEQNLKTVLVLSAEKLLSGNTEWTTTQYNSLKSIADQCRHEGGIGVVMARVAIEEFDYDDEAMCPGAGLPRSSDAARLGALVAPNPASDFCRLTFEQPVNGSLRVYNFQGQVVRNVRFAEASYFELDTRNLSSGLYGIEVRTKQGLRYAGKLSIVR
ncbi:MAG: right-handed parallel beta-helix repeat-containing protein [Saprospiraceae bacterium]|nr:right-handed parallel beta-helix repeat-containing protein [Saprospiraceae bacterium]